MSSTPRIARGVLYAYTFAWVLIAAALFVALGQLSTMADAHGPLPFVLLALAAAAANTYPIQIEIGRNVHSVMLHEIPLVLGAATLRPTLSTAALLVGASVARLFVLRQSPTKFIFNSAVMTVECALVIGTLHVLARNATISESRTWLALLVGVMLADVVSFALVFGAIRLSGGELTYREVLQNTAVGTVGGLVMASLAIVGLLLAEVNPTSLAFVVLGGAAFVVAYRRHVRLRQRFSATKRLERFTRGLAPDRSVEFIADKVLEHAAELMNSEDSAIILAGKTGQVTLARSLRPHSDLLDCEAVGPASEVWERAQRDGLSFTLHIEGDTSTTDRALLSSLSATDIVVAPLVLDENNVGILIGKNRKNMIVRMGPEDLDLITTMAHHAATILERSRLIEQLEKEVSVREYQATHDSLSGLHNRAAFNAMTDAALASSLGANRMSAVMLIDLNHFKKINDTMGHHAGDEVLIQIASRLSDALPVGSNVARLGGDEFAIYLPEIDGPDDALAAAARLREAINLPVSVDDVTFALDAAIGVSIAPLHGIDRHTLLKKADIAMYAGKDRRRVPIALFDSSQQRWTEREVALIEDLRGAIEHRRLWVAYQPKFALEDGAVKGVEALCRWTHPVEGPIRPDEFIRLAEQAGLLDAITEFVIGQALAQCRSWLDDGLEIGMAVNLPAESLRDPTLPKRMSSLAAAAGVPTHLMTLEVTESELIEDQLTSRSVMSDLRGLGFRVSIDDFGTGYSSLAYLHTLPVDELKIDRAFVQRIGTDTTSQQIVHVIVELAKTFGLRTVAEGIEDDDTFDRLRDLGVELAQGFLMGRPAPAAELTSVLRNPYRREAAICEAVVGALGS